MFPKDIWYMISIYLQSKELQLVSKDFNFYNNSCFRDSLKLHYTDDKWYYDKRLLSRGKLSQNKVKMVTLRKLKYQKLKMTII